MRRPSAYAPLSVTFASGRTGTAIQNKYGLEGLAVWAAIIAAAKRGRGQILFATEQDWQAVGVLHPPWFTLKEFLRTTGQMKQTRTETRGHVMYVQLTHYEDWNDDMQRGRERERKSRSERNPTGKRPDTKRNETGNEEELARTAIALELEREEELEIEIEPRAVSETSNGTRPETNSPGITVEQITPKTRSV